MERLPQPRRSLREVLAGETVLHTTLSPDTPSPVTPDQLMDTLDKTTIQRFGKEAGRVAFRACFPDMEELFAARYGTPPEAA